jgi:hypothetical protein
MKAATPAALKMIVAPEIDFTAIDGALRSIGLVRGADATAAPPLVPGEPEFAWWRSPDGAMRVNYSFNPVVLLRVLVFAGADPVKWLALAAGLLPRLEPDTITVLLKAEDPRQVLLGLYAAGEIRASGLLPEIQALRINANRRISETAARTVETLGLALIEAGAARLAAEERRHPDRSAAFAHLGDAELRRGILLQLLYDALPVNGEILKVLRAGLVDESWQVRLTAMLVTVRMNATALWQEVRQMALPGTGRGAPDYRHHSLMIGARKASLAELGGEPRVAARDERSQMMLHLRHVVAGEEDGIHDAARDWLELWIRAPESQAGPTNP